MTSQDTSRNTSHRAGIVKLMQKIAHLCSKERPMHGFVVSRTPAFSPLTHAHIFSRERRLGAIFDKLTIPGHLLALAFQGAAGGEDFLR